MSSCKYFKVWIGYEKFIPIDEEELPRAIAAQITGKIVTLKNGQVRGSAVTVIEPDYHRAMGWNDGYKLGPEDHSEISKYCGDYRGYIGKIKEEVHAALNAGDAKLLT
jgi:hypothetical protein